MNENLGIILLIIFLSIIVFILIYKLCINNCKKKYIIPKIINNGVATCLGAGFAINNSLNNKQGGLGDIIVLTPEQEEIKELYTGQTDINIKNISSEIKKYILESDYNKYQKYIDDIINKINKDRESEQKHSIDNIQSFIAIGLNEFFKNNAIYPKSSKFHNVMKFIKESFKKLYIDLNLPIDNIQTVDEDIFSKKMDSNDETIINNYLTNIIEPIKNLKIQIESIKISFGNKDAFAETEIKNIIDLASYLKIQIPKTNTGQYTKDAVLKMLGDINDKSAQINLKIQLYDKFNALLIKINEYYITIDKTKLTNIEFDLHQLINDYQKLNNKLSSIYVGAGSKKQRPKSGTQRDAEKEPIIMSDNKETRSELSFEILNNIINSIINNKKSSDILINNYLTNIKNDYKNMNKTFTEDISKKKIEEFNKNPDIYFEKIINDLLNAIKELLGDNIYNKYVTNYNNLHKNKPLNINIIEDIFNGLKTTLFNEFNNINANDKYYIIKNPLTDNEINDYESNNKISVFDLILILKQNYKKTFQNLKKISDINKIQQRKIDQLGLLNEELQQKINANIETMRSINQEAGKLTEIQGLLTKCDTFNKTLIDDNTLYFDEINKIISPFNEKQNIQVQKNLLKKLNEVIQNLQRDKATAERALSNPKQSSNTSLLTEQQSELKNLKDSIEIITTQKQQLEGELKACKKRISDQADKIDDQDKLNTQITELTQQLETINIELTRLQDAESVCKKNILDLQSEKEKSNQLILKLEKEKKELQDKLDTAEVELTTQALISTTELSQSTSLKTQIDTLNSEIAKIKASLEANTNNHNAEKERLNFEIERLNREIIDNKTSYDTKIQLIVDEKDGLQTRMTSLQTTIDSLNQQSSTQSSIQSSLQADLNKLTEEKRRLDEEKTRLESTIQTLNINHIQIKERLQAQINKLTSEIETYNLDKQKLKEYINSNYNNLDKNIDLTKIDTILEILNNNNTLKHVAAYNELNTKISTLELKLEKLEELRKKNIQQSEDISKKQTNLDELQFIKNQLKQCNLKKDELTKQIKAANELIFDLRQEKREDVEKSKIYNEIKEKNDKIIEKLEYDHDFIKYMFAIINKIKLTNTTKNELLKLLNEYNNSDLKSMDMNEFIDKLNKLKERSYNFQEIKQKSSDYLTESAKKSSDYLKDSAKKSSDYLTESAKKSSDYLKDSAKKSSEYVKTFNFNKRKNKNDGLEPKEFEDGPNEDDIEESKGFLSNLKDGISNIFGNKKNYVKMDNKESDKIAGALYDLAKRLKTKGTIEEKNLIIDTFRYTKLSQMLNLLIDRIESNGYDIVNTFFKKIATDANFINDFKKFLSGQNELLQLRIIREKNNDKILELKDQIMSQDEIIKNLMGETNDTNISTLINEFGITKEIIQDKYNKSELQLQECDRIKQIAEGELNNVKLELDSLNNEKKELETNLNLLTVRFNELQKSDTENQSQLTRLIGENKELTTSLNELKQINNNNNQLLSTFAQSANIIKPGEKLKNISKDALIKQLQQTFSEFKKKGMNIYSKAKELYMKQQFYTNKVKEVEMLEIDYKNENESLKNALYVLFKIYKGVYLQNEELEKNIKIKDQQIEKLSKILKTTETELSNKNYSNEEKIRRLKNRLENYDKVNNTTVSFLLTVDNKYATDLLNLNKTIDYYKNLYTIDEEKIRKLETTISQLTRSNTNQIEILNKEIEKLKDNNKNLIRERDELQDKLTSCNKNFSSKELEFVKILKENKRLIEENKKLNTNLTKCVKYNKTYTQQNKLLLHDVNDCLSKNKTFAKDSDTLIKKIVKLEKELSLCGDDKTKLKIKLDNENKQKVELQRQFLQQEVIKYKK